MSRKLAGKDLPYYVAVDFPLFLQYFQFDPCLLPEETELLYNRRDAGIKRA